MNQQLPATVRLGLWLLLSAMVAALLIVAWLERRSSRPHAAMTARASRQVLACQLRRPRKRRPTKPTVGAVRPDCPAPTVFPRDVEVPRDADQ